MNIYSFYKNQNCQVLDNEFRKSVLSFADNIKWTREIGTGMILDRTSNGKFRPLGDILDCIISEF